MIDLTKIDFDQANKIECALLQMEHHFKEQIECYDRLAVDPEFTDKARVTFKCNAEWWRAVHALIYGEDE